jgi:hypothetical protein
MNIYNMCTYNTSNRYDTCDCNCNCDHSTTNAWQYLQLAKVTRTRKLLNSTNGNCDYSTINLWLYLQLA